MAVNSPRVLWTGWSRSGAWTRSDSVLAVTKPVRRAGNLRRRVQVEVIGIVRPLESTHSRGGQRRPSALSRKVVSHEIVLQAARRPAGGPDARRRRPGADDVALQVQGRREA